MSSCSRSSARDAFRTRTRSSRRWRRSCAATAVVVSVVVAGCGGDDEHDAFVEDANAVCAEHISEVDALPAPESNDQLLDYVNELARLYRVQLDDLRELDPPEGDAAEYRRMLAQMQVTLGLYPALQDAVRTGLPVAIDSVLERANASNEQAGEAAVELGLDDCVPGESRETTTDR